MNDNELFNLCREVYEKTRWDEKKDYLWLDNSFHDSHPEWDTIETAHHDMSGKGIPLYTSDYLLEKLLPITNIDFIRQSDGRTLITYAVEVFEEEWLIADTPLKALLKLVLALHEAGELE